MMGIFADADKLASFEDILFLLLIAVVGLSSNPSRMVYWGREKEHLNSHRPNPSPAAVRGQQSSLALWLLATLNLQCMRLSKLFAITCCSLCLKILLALFTFRG